MPLPPRKHCPASVKLRVAWRQLGLSPAIVRVMAENAERHRHATAALRSVLGELARKLGCEVSELRRDHEPALGTRFQVWRRGKFIDYDPPENNPDAMIYRSNAEHLVKTHVRGDHGQHSDTVLMKRERRRKTKATKPKHKWPTGRKLRSRGFERRRK